MQGISQPAEELLTYVSQSVSSGSVLDLNKCRYHVPVQWQIQSENLNIQEKRPKLVLVVCHVLK